MHSVLRHLRQTTLQREHLSDGQLLDQYLRQTDEAAVTELVRRHGNMVWGVCRRLLANTHDAEDAFQATFVVFARKANTIRPRNNVGSWLYGVAYRTALKLRIRLAKRRTREKPLIESAGKDKPPGEAAELRQRLDQALQRLPAKYRLPILLCELDGLTRKEAAQRLGWPEGTVATRLLKAKTLLAKQLAHLGATLSTLGLASALAVEARANRILANLSLSMEHVLNQIHLGRVSLDGIVSVTVLNLSHGVLRTMASKKILTVALVILVLVGGSLTLLWQPQVAGGDRQSSLPSAQAKKQQLSDAIQNAQSKAKTAIKQLSTTKMLAAWHSDSRGPHALVQALNEELDLKELKLAPLRFRQLFQVIGSRIVINGMPMGILIEPGAFECKELSELAGSVSNMEIDCSDMPDTLPFAVFFRHILKQIPTHNATYIIRRGILVITTEERASTKALLQEKVTGIFDQQPVGQVLLDLGFQTGAHIHLDARAGDKLQTPVAAVFAHNVSLKSAIAMLTATSGLQMVEMEEGLYITTSENAAKIRK